MVFHQYVLSITTLTIIYNFSVLMFLNFNLTPSAKVLGDFERLPESIKDTNNTLRLHTRLDKVRDEHLKF